MFPSVRQSHWLSGIQVLLLSQCYLFCIVKSISLFSETLRAKIVSDTQKYFFLQWISLPFFYFSNKETQLYVVNPSTKAHTESSCWRQLFPTAYITLDQMSSTDNIALSSALQACRRYFPLMLANERPKWSYYSSSHSSRYTSGKNTRQNRDPDCSGSSSAHYSTCLALPHLHGTCFLFHPHFLSYFLIICLYPPHPLSLQPFYQFLFRK